MPQHLQIINHALPITPAPPFTPIGHLVMYASLAVAVLVLVTFIVLISGWSGLTSAIRRSSAPDRRRLRLLAWTPVLALLTDVALLVAQGSSRPNTFRSSAFGGPPVASGGNPTALHILNVVVPTVALVGWLVSVACVAVAARRANSSPSDLRFGKSVAVIVAWLFTLLLIAYATWSIALIVQARQSAGGTYTTIGNSHPRLWLPMMFVLAVGVGLSGLSARAARSSWKVISTAFL